MLPGVGAKDCLADLGIEARGGLDQPLRQGQGLHFARSKSGFEIE